MGILLTAARWYRLIFFLKLIDGEIMNYDTKRKKQNGRQKHRSSMQYKAILGDPCNKLQEDITNKINRDGLTATVFMKTCSVTEFKKMYPDTHDYFV